MLESRFAEEGILLRLKEGQVSGSGSGSEDAEERYIISRARLSLWRDEGLIGQ